MQCLARVREIGKHCWQVFSGGVVEEAQLATD